ncbi:hypothetical protein Trydic_g18701 [Trypoxylus dichotomus]
MKILEMTIVPDSRGAFCVNTKQTVDNRNKVSMGKDTVYRILIKELGTRKNCANLAPKILSDEQEESRFSISQPLIDHLIIEPSFWRRSMDIQI